jgi:hypothetical protein
MESDELRQRLTRALAAEPEFMARQFVEAALSCLEAGLQTRQAGTTMADTETVAQFQPAPASSHSTPRSADAASNTDHPSPPDATPLVPVAVPVSIVDPPAGPASQPSPPRALSQRIPTLLPHDGRPPEPTAAAEIMIIARPHPSAPRLPVPAAGDADATRFDPHAIGLEEADVQIVTRTPTAAPLLDARLPPLPLNNQSPKPLRPSRAPVAKWADTDADQPDDYRPIGSALDEAQVTIIAVDHADEARTRAERRALGVAPDREGQMRRFLKALSGD